MKAPFEGYAVYDWQESLGHWSLIAYINSNHIHGRGLRFAVQSILSIGTTIEPRVFHHSVGNEISLTLDNS